VLAAAQLHDPDLTERYSEEWLANLRHRAHLQQWRDAVSLLLRGVRTTRWPTTAPTTPDPGWSLPSR
jgi:hypothetical protein